MTVGILGLGLIGGSLARAYAIAGHTVYASVRNESMLAFAQLACPFYESQVGHSCTDLQHLDWFVCHTEIKGSTIT